MSESEHEMSEAEHQEIADALGCGRLLELLMVTASRAAGIPEPEHHHPIVCNLSNEEVRQHYLFRQECGLVLSPGADVLKPVSLESLGVDTSEWDLPLGAPRRKHAWVGDVPVVRAD